MKRINVEAKQSKWSLCETFALSEVIDFARKTSRTGNAYAFYEKARNESCLQLRSKKNAQIDAKLLDLRKKTFVYSPLYCYEAPKKY